MKFKFFKGVIATVVVTLFIGYGVNKSVNSSNTELGNLTLTNVEALAYPEGMGDVIDINIGFTTGHIGPNLCVCKAGICSDGAYVTFRKVCGRGQGNSYCSGKGDC